MDYRKLAAWNNINKPFVISINQKIYLSGASAKISTNKAAKTKKSIKKTISYKNKKTPSHQVSSNSNWLWPTKGKVIRNFSTKYANRDGIDILGKLGQPIKAVRSGKVVYSGSGLKGLGNLIIIKHDKNYFSAYAYNKANLVKEGQWVKQGQTVAKMGLSPNKKPVLHFEIRYKGNPKNPLAFLNKS